MKYNTYCLDLALMRKDEDIDSFTERAKKENLGHWIEYEINMVEEIKNLRIKNE